MATNPTFMDLEEYQAMAKGIGEWMIGRATGTSSKALAACALIQSAEFEGDGFPDYPRDAPDLRRCVDLIARVPGVASALPIIAGRSAVWAAYVANWPELTMLANMGNYRTTTDRMDALRKEATAAAA